MESVPCGAATMKYLDLDDLDGLPGIRLNPGDRFAFRCHSEIACFNRCCRNLNLFLYPYDVLRLKSGLAITSDEFLETYVDVVLRPGNFFPEVLLRMSETKEKTCPFLTDAGCAVYPDRPDACRTFPLEQGIVYDAARKKKEAVFLFRPPEFCLGPHESSTWTTADWTADQEAGVYHRMTIRWAEIKQLFHSDPWGHEGPAGPRAKMAFMATYNMDRFRDFVFHSSFLKRYRVTSDELKRMRAGDKALLTFGFSWVKFFLWGIPSRRFKPR
jgi:Fe-S-cluster containining protein